MTDLAERALANGSAAIQLAQGLYEAQALTALELRDLAYQTMDRGERATTDALIAVLQQHVQLLAKVHQDYAKPNALG